MAMKNIFIKEVVKKDDQTLGIEWMDGQNTLYNVVELRRKCPCASCVDEMSGQRTLNARDVSDNVRPIKVFSIGRYAMGIQFNDSHSTGIYTFEYLRQLAGVKS